MSKPLRTVTLAACVVAATVPVSAQHAASNRTTVEAVAAVSTSTEAIDDPMVILDATSTTRLTRGLDVIVRPYSRRLPGGDWSAEMYQLQIRYQTDTRIPIRVDAGVISSPLGLGTLELRPDRNPVIGGAFYYYVPLPAFDNRFDRVQLLSGGYPVGIVASTSTAKWDARVGITDGTPARPRRAFGSDRPDAAAQVLAGGGFSPVPGLRLGAGFARGPYRSADAPDATGGISPGRTVSVFNLEGDYAIGYTRVAGEWIADSFETATTPAVARGYTLLAVRTLTPRWFVAGRSTRVSTPVQTPAGRVRRASTGADVTLGYRLTTDFTLRGGYQGSRGFRDAGWQHAAVTSLVWSKRWW